ncbi:hypothetical protein LTR09_003571 [Extremus antarcticus]|uniref:Uncharacterized protein n=1 Tax=Extremus antarcticus TaxID=702011 RepID=A0AAJ0DSM4_9PEZI|nr:hypothetical protein LTR09_003571 [Extremus antarcticus]
MDKEEAISRKRMAFSAATSEELQTGRVGYGGTYPFPDVALRVHLAKKFVHYHVDLMQKYERLRTVEKEGQYTSAPQLHPSLHPKISESPKKKNTLVKGWSG